MSSIELRLKWNINIIKKKYRKLFEAISEDSDLEIYCTVADLLNWVVNTDDLMYKNYDSYQNNKKKNEKIDKVLRGLRHAYNSFKHNMNITSVESRRFDQSIYDIPIKAIIWVNSDKVYSDIINNNTRKNFDSYKDCLENEQVIVTFREAIEFLEKESSEILKS